MTKIIVPGDREVMDREGKVVKLVKSNEDMFSTWDVGEDHYCYNIKQKLLYDVFKTIEDRLKAEHPELLDESDYFMVDCCLRRDRGTITWPKGRIAVFYVKGGSEGYYVHVEALQDGRNECLILGKTLHEGEAGIKWAEQMVLALSRIIEV